MNPNPGDRMERMERIRAQVEQAANNLLRQLGEDASVSVTYTDGTQQTDEPADLEAMRELYEAQRVTDVNQMEFVGDSPGYTRQFNIGDIVCLKTGGPGMNVINVATNSPYSVCGWFDMNCQYHEIPFPDSCLTIFREGTNECNPTDNFGE